MNESPSSPPPPDPESAPPEPAPVAPAGAGAPEVLPPAQPSGSEPSPWAAGPPPPGAPVPAGAAPPPAIEYGGFWIRLAAYLIDGLILGIIGLLIGIPFALLYGLTDSAVNATAQSIAAFNLAVSGINLAISVGYFAWFWVRTGSTPGMTLLGLQVVREADGGQIGLGAALVRYVGIIISTIALFIGLIWVAFDSRKRGWHDMLAGTVVIRKPDVPMTGGRRAVMIGAIGCGCLLPLVAIVAIVGLLFSGPALQDIFGDIADDLARGSGGQIEQPVGLPYGSLRVGDCFELLDPANPSIAIVQAVPCADEHVYEVFFVGDMPDGDYPGEDAVAAFADQNCLPAFEAYVGVPFEESTWSASPVGPLEEDWAAGSRRVTCQLHSLDQVPVTGSARGSGD